MNKFLSFILLFLTSFSIWGKDTAALAKSDSLFAKGVELYNLQKYKEAIPLFVESDRIDNAELDPTSNRREYSALWLASCYYKIGDEKQARSINENYYMVHPIDRRLTIASDSVLAAATNFYNNEDYLQALEKFKECAEIEKSILGENNFCYANTLLKIAFTCSILGDHKEAIKLGTETLKIMEHTLSKEHPDYANCINTLASLYYNYGDYKEALRLGKEALNLREKLWGKENPEYANSLNNLAHYYSAIDDYQDAIKYGIESLNIRERILGKENPDYANTLNSLSIFYYHSGDLEEAIKLGTEALNIRERILGKDHPDYAFSLKNLETYYSDSGDIKEAVKYGTEMLRIDYQMGRIKPLDYINTLEEVATKCSELGYYTSAIEIITESLNAIEYLLGPEHPHYISSLNTLAVNYHYSGNNMEAISVSTKVLNITERVHGKNHPNYATALNNLALFYSESGDNKEAIRLETEALSIMERILGKDHPNYIYYLSNLAGHYAALEDYEKAISIETEVLKIRAKKIGRGHPDFATSLNFLFNYCSALDDYDEALKLTREKLNIEQKMGDIDPMNYVNCLDGLALIYFELGDYLEAIDLSTESLNIKKNILSNLHPACATSLNDLAYFYFHTNDYNEAIRLETEALNITEQTLSKEHPAYATYLNNQALFYAHAGDYKEAIRFGTESLNISERTLGKDHKDHITMLETLANCFSQIGNYEESIRLGTEALNISEQTFGKDHPDYATALDNLALYYSRLGNYEEAIRLGTEAMNIRERTLGKNHPEYARSLHNLATSYFVFGNLSEAAKFATEALRMEERLLGKEHPEYVKSLNNLAFHLSEIGNYTEAVKLGLEALNTTERTKGKQHPDYIMFLINLSWYNYHLGKDHEVIELLEEGFPLFSYNIRTNFSGLTTQERNNFWNKNKSFFEEVVNIYTYHINSESLISNAYDATLLSKGILLSTEKELSSILQESEDEKVIELYNELKKTRLRINKLYEKPKAERQVDTDSLERLANALERDLVEKSKEYGDFTRNMTISWKDVQSKLKKNDLAIEFVSFPIQQDSMIYMAYVINKQLEFPQMVKLFDAKDLSKIKPDNYYSTTELSKLVWNNLDPYLKDAENVYFAPSGELYNIAIESLPYYNGEGLMSDFHNIYRLSSTRELAITKAKNDYTKAVLYGGMKFDTEAAFLNKDMEKYPELKNRNFSFTNVADSLNLRYEAIELPGTAIEVDNIERYLKKTSIKPFLYKGLEGTEASFKSLSGKKVNIMHLATHGFYWTEKEARRAMDVSFLMSGDENSSRYIEDKALTRSGLLFSGANNALQGVALPEGVEDGILTAKEIAELDLRGLDMVILSACQTGLGEITGDGVFGLQRGFKKAGANSLLMSLWKVDDDATQILMTKFYEEFLGGKSKFEALKSAQKYLREYQPKEKARNNIRPYDDPKYWAAFILLDAYD